PGAGEALLEADAAGPGRVVPQAVPGGVLAGAGEVGSREPGQRLGGSAVVEDRPRREPLAGELLGVQVLVEVEEAEDPLAGEGPLGAGDVVEVARAVTAGMGLDGLVDDAEPDRVEAVAAKELRVGSVEARRA